MKGTGFPAHLRVSVQQCFFRQEKRFPVRKFLQSFIAIPLIHFFSWEITHCAFATLLLDPKLRYNH